MIDSVIHSMNERVIHHMIQWLSNVSRPRMAAHGSTSDVIKGVCLGEHVRGVCDSVTVTRSAGLLSAGRDGIACLLGAVASPDHDGSPPLPPVPGSSV